MELEDASFPLRNFSVPPHIMINNVYEKKKNTRNAHVLHLFEPLYKLTHSNFS